MHVLSTPRLTLRWFHRADAPFILELLNDPSWLANIGDRGVRTLEDAVTWIEARLVESYWRQGFGLWAVEQRSDGTLVGMCGLVDRDSLPEIDVGYAIAPRFRGKGYAREATAACLEYARDVLGKERVLAIVLPSNERSIRVLESVGMKSEGLRTLAGERTANAFFSWTGRAPFAGDKAEIDDLVGRFFSFFSNVHGASRVGAVPFVFLPEAIITCLQPSEPRGIDVSGVRDFVTPRAGRLANGTLTRFEEREVESHTEIEGGLAFRSSRYEKSGVRDGTPFRGGGQRHFQLVRTRRGWRIAALTWEDFES